MMMISDVKKKLYEKEDIDVSCVNFVYDGKQTEDTKTIKFYNMKEESKLITILKINNTKADNVKKNTNN
jgi:stress response protein SCP2